jgi:nucleoside-diphosphate-sugar epimerase
VGVISIIKIALLGATSHIAKNLLIEFNKKQLYQLYLFARSPESCVQFQKEHSKSITLLVYPFEDFNNHHYDVIINCVGIGDPGKLADQMDAIFTVTEKFDQMIIDYLKFINDQALYISLSSGAAYNSAFDHPADELSYSKISINNVKPTDYYAVAKVNSEVKHRALSKLNIVDLRIFVFFSRYIALDSKFLMTQIIACLRSKTRLKTSADNIIRDYVHPKDLIKLIELCIEKNKINEVFDVYSLKPIEKFGILQCFSEKFGLQYEVTYNHTITSATGNKLNYYSTNRKAESIGYKPRISSLDCLIGEYDAMKL